MSHERIADVLSRDDIRALTRSSNLAGAWAIASTWSVIALAFAALARWPTPLVFVAVVIVLGGRQLALAVMMHDAAHGTLFRTRVLNDVLGDLVCGRPVWSDVVRYRAHHLAHHAHTGTDRDPDLGLAPVEPMSRGSLARKLARDVTGASGVRRVLGLLLIDAELLGYDVGAGALRIQRRTPRHHVAALARNLWKPLAAQLVLAGILVAAGCGWVYLAWAVAYLTAFSLFLRVRSLAEHACMARGSDAFVTTRTTRASWLARATVAPFHVNLHLEHHLVPTVPWFRLPALSRALETRDAIPIRSRAADYIAVLSAVSAARTPAAAPPPP